MNDGVRAACARTSVVQEIKLGERARTRAKVKGERGCSCGLLFHLRCHQRRGEDLQRVAGAPGAHFWHPHSAKRCVPCQRQQPMQHAV